MEPVLKILLLEDTMTDADMIRHVLRKEKRSVEVKLVMNRDAFLQGLEDFQPDLILSDNCLPQFSATEALEIMRQKALDIPFILVTGTVSEEFAAGIIKLGADDYILKDRLTRLPSAIDNALKQSRVEKERKEAIEKLKQSEENLSTIFENTSEGFVLLDSGFIVKAFNENGKNYLFSNMQRQLVTGENLLDFISHSRTAFVEETLNKVLSGEKIQYDHHNENKDGAAWISFTMMPVIKNEKIEGVCITVRDITGRIQSEERQRAMVIQEQKKISRAIIKAQEKERNHIGQELHDNVNQILAAIKIYMDKAMRDNPETNQSIRQPYELVSLCMEEIRQLSQNLVTPVNDIDLRSMLLGLLGPLSENTSIQTQLDYDLPDAQAKDDDLKLNIYRIIQEQVNNIVKHAAAEHIHVSVLGTGNHIRVTVTDDGRGFDLSQKRQGIGIANMTNRVKSFNGELQLQSTPGNGCTLQLTIPSREPKE
jgi:PAS domain S-box-containing protein